MEGGREKRNEQRMEEGRERGRTQGEGGHEEREDMKQESEAQTMDARWHTCMASSILAS